MENTSKNYKIAYLVATGCALQIAESLFPHPLPGVRLGLANIITLVGLNVFGFTAGMQVAVLRPVVSSFILGNFLTPGFMLSFSGSLVSFLVMAIVYWISIKLENYVGFRLFSNIGISIFGALSHNFVQLCVAYLLFVRHTGIFSFVPVLLVSGLLTGWFTGFCVNYLMSRNELVNIYSGDSYRDLKFESESEISSTDIIKIMICLLLILVLILISSIKTMLYFVPVVLVQGVIFRISVKKFFSQLRFLWILIFSSLMIHMLFTPGETIFSFSIMKISKHGLLNAGGVGLRIMLLVYLSSILVWRTPWAEFINKFTIMPIPSKLSNFLLIIPLSLSLYPLIWQRIQGIKPRTLKNLLNNLL